MIWFLVGLAVTASIIGCVFWGRYERKREELRKEGLPDSRGRK